MSSQIRTTSRLSVKVHAKSQLVQVSAACGATLLVGLLIASLTGEAAAGRFSQVVVFGESTSDAGNQFAASDGAFPPYSSLLRGSVDQWSNLDRFGIRASWLGVYVTKPERGHEFRFWRNTIRVRRRRLQIARTWG